MKPILLGLTVGILFAYHVGGVVARNLQPRWSPCRLYAARLGLINWQAAEVFAVAWCGQAVADPDWDICPRRLELSRFLRLRSPRERKSLEGLFSRRACQRD